MTTPVEMEDKPVVFHLDSQENVRTPHIWLLHRSYAHVVGVQGRSVTDREWVNKHNGH